MNKNAAEKVHNAGGQILCTNAKRKRQKEIKKINYIDRFYEPK